jgi:hypothetical protein
MDVIITITEALLKGIEKLINSFQTPRKNNTRTKDADDSK